MPLNLFINNKNIYQEVIFQKKKILIMTSGDKLKPNINICLSEKEQLIDQTAVDFILKEVLVYIFHGLNYQKIIETNLINNIIESIQPLIKASCVTEREIFELFGIFFNNAFDLRRLLTDYSLIGNPLKKIFPVIGFLEIHYSTYKNIIHQKINLSQDMRAFEKKTLWEN